MPDDLCHPTLEADLAQQLGLDRQLLRATRAQVLTEKDWALVQGAGITYTPAGVEKVLTHLQIAPPEKNGAGVPALALDGPRRLYVRRPARLNRHILFATAEKNADGPEIAVRVRDCRQFTPGQEIHVQLESGHARLHGRQPRGGRRLRFPQP